MRVIVDNNIPDHANIGKKNQILLKLFRNNDIDFYITILNVVEAAFTPDEITRTAKVKWYSSFPFKGLLTGPLGITRKELYTNDLCFSELVESEYGLSDVCKTIITGRNNPEVEKLYRKRLLTPIRILRIREKPYLYYSHLDMLEEYETSGNAAIDKDESIINDLDDKCTAYLLNELDRLLNLKKPSKMSKVYFTKYRTYVKTEIEYRTKMEITEETAYLKIMENEVSGFISNALDNAKYLRNSNGIALNLLGDVLWIEGQNRPSIKKLKKKITNGTVTDIDYSAYIPYIDYFITNDEYLRDTMINGHLEGSKAISLEEFISKYC